jgi:hypothetical protein
MSRDITVDSLYFGVEQVPVERKDGLLPGPTGWRYTSHRANISSQSAESTRRSFTSVGNAGKYSPASTLWTYRALMPTFSANASCVSPLASRRREMFLPNFDRTGQCDGFRVGTPTYSPPRKESNTRLYLVCLAG